MSSACWSCSELVGEGVLCSHCYKLQPVVKKSAFLMLNLPMTFDLDMGLLEQNYFKAQRMVHPDRFATSDKTQKLYSAQHSAAINEAYLKLKDPIKRTAEILKVEGYIQPNIELQTLDDPELLMEVIELREELLEVQTEEQSQKLKNKIDTLFDGNIHALSTAFSSKNLDQASKLLNRLRYLSKIRFEANQRKAA